MLPWSRLRRSMARRHPWTVQRIHSGIRWWLIQTRCGWQWQTATTKRKRKSSISAEWHQRASRIEPRTSRNSWTGSAQFTNFPNGTDPKLIHSYAVPTSQSTKSNFRPWQEPTKFHRTRCQRIERLRRSWCGMWICSNGKWAPAMLKFRFVSELRSQRQWSIRCCIRWIPMASDDLEGVHKNIVVRRCYRWSWYCSNGRSLRWRVSVCCR